VAAFTGNSVVGQVIVGDGHVVSSGQHGVVNGVASAQAFGALYIAITQTTGAGGVLSAQSFGTPKIAWSQIVQVPGLPQQTGLRSIVGGVISGDGHLVGGTGLQFGFVKLVPGRVTVGVPGLGSAQQFGKPWIAFWQPLPVLGVPSAQQFGKPLVFKVWVRPISCISIDLLAAVQTNLDLTASEAEDLDLQPAGCD